VVSTFHASRLKNGAGRQKLSLEPEFATSIPARRIMGDEMVLAFKAIHPVISHLSRLASASPDRR
jgi:hypothetical protein